MAVVTPLNNFLGPESDTVTADMQLPKYQSTSLLLPPSKRETGSESSFITQSRDGLRYKHVVLVNESSNVSGPPPPTPHKDHQAAGLYCNNMHVTKTPTATSTSDIYKITKIPRLHCKLPPTHSLAL